MQSRPADQVFQTLLEQHRGILYKVAKAYCPSEAEQEDLIQEIMIQIWQSLNRYDAAYKTSTWIYRIALNVAISSYRKNRTRQQQLNTLTSSEASETDQKSLKEQQLELLEQFIAELRQLDKALMILYLEGRSHVEMAEILGISTSNVATKIGRIKAQLKQRFTQHQHYQP